MTTAHKQHTKAFDLGAQSKRAGLGLDRMAEYYKGYASDAPRYCPDCMKAGWVYQQRKAQTVR